MIHVHVIASSPLLRAGIEALVREDPRFALIPALNSAMSVTEGRPARTDVLLMEAVSVQKVLAVQSRFAGEDAPPIVLLADGLRRADVRRALRSGIRAILPRDASGHEIVSTIEAVTAGLTVLSTEDMEALLPTTAETEAKDEVAGEALSSRELEVLGLMAEGIGNKDIASRLSISEHTVKFHVSAILGKLGVTSRGEAVARGVRAGLIVI